MTRWQVTHLSTISIERRLLIPGLFVPETIKKIRNIRSVTSYEIIWRTDHDIIEKLKECIALDKENEESDTEFLSELTSIEPQGDVLKCYPELVEVFENAKSAKAKAKKRTTKKKAQNNADTNNKEDDKPGNRRQKRGTKNSKDAKNNRKIDEFISKNGPLSLEDSFEKMSITPKRSKKVDKQNEKQEKDRMKRGPQFDKVLQVENKNSKLNNTLDRMFNELSPDDFLSDNADDDLNMTEIIDDICSKRIFRFNIVKNIKISENKNNLTTRAVEHPSTINEPLDQILDNETEVNHCQKDNDDCDQFVDEFDNINESYVPLNQRLLTYRGKDAVQKISVGTNERFSLGFNDLMNDTDPDSAQFIT